MFITVGFCSSDPPRLLVRTGNKGALLLAVVARVAHVFNLKSWSFSWAVSVLLYGSNNSHEFKKKIS